MQCYICIRICRYGGELYFRPIYTEYLWILIPRFSCVFCNYNDKEIPILCAKLGWEWLFNALIDGSTHKLENNITAILLLNFQFSFFSITFETFRKKSLQIDTECSEKWKLLFAINTLVLPLWCLNSLSQNFLQSFILASTFMCEHILSKTGIKKEESYLVRIWYVTANKWNMRFQANRNMCSMTR